MVVVPMVVVMEEDMEVDTVVDTQEDMEVDIGANRTSLIRINCFI